jgi:hypothetical protein
MPLSHYQQLISSYSQKYDLLQRRLHWLGIARLLIFVAVIVFGYFHFIYPGSYWLIIALCLLGLFFYSIRVYQTIKGKAELTRALIDINKKEVDILNGQPSTYPRGAEFIDPHHPYSYDLDIFGEGSLFGFLNRTTTSFGKESFAAALLNPDTKTIRERQEAIKELTGKIDLRQQMQASGSLHAIK